MVMVLYYNTTIRNYCKISQQERIKIPLWRAVARFKGVFP